jgi:uncharacterized membrane protein
MATPSERSERDNASPVWTSHALEWGIGSIIIGFLTLLVMTLGATAAAIGLGVYRASSRYTVGNVENIFALVAVVIILTMLLAGLGLWFGIRGMRHARSRDLPAGVPATGVVMCAVFLVVLGVGLGTTLAERHDTLQNFQKRGLTQDSIIP